MSSFVVSVCYRQTRLQKIFLQRQRLHSCQRWVEWSHCDVLVCTENIQDNWTTFFRYCNNVWYQPVRRMPSQTVFLYFLCLLVFWFSFSLFRSTVDWTNRVILSVINCFVDWLIKRLIDWLIAVLAGGNKSVSQSAAACPFWSVQLRSPATQQLAASNTLDEQVPTHILVISFK